MEQDVGGEDPRPAVRCSHGPDQAVRSAMREPQGSCGEKPSAYSRRDVGVRAQMIGVRGKRDDQIILEVNPGSQGRTIMPRPHLYCDIFRKIMY